MSSEENLRKLGNCITALEEEADKLRKHADALLKKSNEESAVYLRPSSRTDGMTWQHKYTRCQLEITLEVMYE